MSTGNSGDLAQSCHFSFEKEECETVQTARAFSGLTAVLLSLLALGLILLLKAYRSYTHRLFLYLTLSTLLHTPLYILESFSVHCQTNSTIPRHTQCEVTGSFVMYISWIQNLVVLWITGYLFRFVVLRVVFNSRKVEIAILILFLLLPIPLALLPLNKYGVSGAWCWIVSHKKGSCKQIDFQGLGYQLGLWYVPVALETIAITIMVIWIMSVLCNRSYRKTKYVTFQSEYRQLMKQSLPLLVFPIVFCVLSIFEMVLDLLGINHKLNFEAWVFDAVVNPCKVILMILGYLASVSWVKCKGKCRETYLKDGDFLEGNTNSIRIAESAENDYGTFGKSSNTSVTVNTKFP